MITVLQERQRVRQTLVIISFLLFPAFFYYFSPYLIIDATLKGIINGSFIIFTLQFIAALVVGRAFCGWVCPAAGAQEIILGLNFKPVKRGDLIKWFIWTPWVVMIILLAIKGGGYREIDFTYMTANGLSISDLQSLVTYMLVLSLIVIPAFVVGRRSFCHHICWMAPFMILGRKFRNLLHLPALQLHAMSAVCDHCHTCLDHCPMSLPVETMVRKQQMEDSECVLCGTCVDGCPSGAIEFEFRKPRA